jgi:hypothetical protein
MDFPPEARVALLPENCDPVVGEIDGHKAPPSALKLRVLEPRGKEEDVSVFRHEFHNILSRSRVKGKAESERVGLIALSIGWRDRVAQPFRLRIRRWPSGPSGACRICHYGTQTEIPPMRGFL